MAQSAWKCGSFKFPHLTPINSTSHLHCKRNCDDTTSCKTTAKLIRTHLLIDKRHKVSFSWVKKKRGSILPCLVSICCFIHKFHLTIWMTLTPRLSGNHVRLSSHYTRFRLQYSLVLILLTLLRTDLCWSCSPLSSQQENVQSHNLKVSGTERLVLQHTVQSTLPLHLDPNTPQLFEWNWPYPM